MTRSELVALARRLHMAEGSEAQLDDLMDQLDEALPHSDVITLLFQNNPQLTVEAAIDEALRREASWKDAKG